MKISRSLLCFVLFGISVFAQHCARGEEFPGHMVEFLRPGMYVGTPRQEKRNKVFVVLASQRQSEIYNDAIFRSLPELREKYPEIDEQASIALTEYVAGIRKTANQQGDVNVEEPTLRFSGFASSYVGNLLYYSKIVHIGENYILLESSQGRREAIKKSQIESVEWAPRDLSRTVTVVPAKKK